MDSIIEQITEWIKGILVAGTMENLDGMFTSVNEQVGSIAAQLGTTPPEFSPAVFAMIRTLSDTVIMPVAGMVLTFVACYELIQMVLEHNNMANFDSWFVFRWVFKTCIAVMLVSNTFDIVMAVFEAGQHIVNESTGLIAGSTGVDAGTLESMRSAVESMELGPLTGLYFQSFIIRFLVYVLSVAVFVIVYGRMIEIYLMASVAPIPFATFGNREQGQTGQNYLKGLIALALQGFLLMVCVGIYAALVHGVSVTDDIIGSLWGIVGYTVLLCFTMFSTGTLAKRILSVH